VLLNLVQDNVQLESWPPSRIGGHRNHDQMAGGQFEPQLALIGAHDRCHDTLPAKDAERLGDLPESL
jgi:hypothetical protein